MAEHKVVYRWSRDYAKKYDELDLWRESYRENSACARAIEKAIEDNYRDNHLNTDSVQDVISDFGWDRVQWVLANTIQQHGDDGRFSPDNRKWANTFFMPEDDILWHYSVECHPGLVNMFADRVQKEWEALGLYDRSHCLEDGDYEGRLIIMKPSSLKDQFDESKTMKPDNLMRVVYVEPNKPPYIAEIAHTLDAEQQAVQGLIEVVYPHNGDDVCYICNEEGKLICMNCGRVMPWDERYSFEQLATAYEYSSTSGAERAYKKIVDKLTGLLVDAGVLGMVELKLTEKNKKIAATYEYKAVHRYANDDDEWGEIRFDFSVGTAEIEKWADGDFSKTNVFAKIAIRQILKFSMSELPKKLTIPFELEMEKIRYGS